MARPSSANAGNGTPGLTTTVNAKYATAIAAIRDRSSANLASLQSDAVLPVDGGLFIARAAAQTLRDAKPRCPILVVGDAGSGKSGVLQDFATSRQATEEVVVLLAADVAGTNRVDVGTPLQEVLRGWTGPPALLVIDGVDALRGSGDRETLSNTVTALSGTRWQVVASARTFDTTNSRPLQKAFAGEPISSNTSEVHGRLASVRHLLVGDLSDEDLNREIVSPMPLADLLAEAPDDLRALLRNPFNLRLAAELATSLTASQHYELLRVRTRVELLSRYWEWRIRGAGAHERESLLRRLAASMVSSRRLQVEQAEPAVLSTDTTALEDMLSHGVLTSADGPIPGMSRVIGFSHNILFDYATAIYVLYVPSDPNGLAKQLEADPSLPLIARPSFELLVDMLWQARSNGVFWPTAVAVASGGHVLASLAIAARVANLAVEADDLLELAAPDTDATNGTMKGRQHLTGQLAGAVRARAVVHDVGRVLLPLARLAKALAERAATSYTDAALATDLILALQNRAPAGSVDIDGSTQERARAITLLLDACRTDPARMEYMVGYVTPQVQHVVADSADVREALRRIIDDTEALAQWGGTVTMWFPEIAAKVIGVDPDLAHRLAVTSMTFDETRDGDVSFGNSSVLPLRESRRQQAKHAAYRLSELYGQLASTDVHTATAIICSIVDHVEPTSLQKAARSREDAPKWPMAISNASGWIEHDYSYGFSAHWHDDEQKMLKAIADALLDTTAETVAKSLDLLVDELHAGWTWAALMNDPSDSGRLFGVLQPAFATGTLLAHPNTHTQAANLLKAAAEHGTVPHRELEMAVRNAIDLLETYGRGDHIKDVLVGCLDRAAITDVDLASRRDTLGDQIPEIPSPPSTHARAAAWSTVDHILGTEGPSLDSDVEAAARALEKALNDLNVDKGNDEAKSAELDTTLISAFAEAHAVFSSQGAIHVRLEQMLLDGAVRLAYLSDITPEHPMGPLVLRTVEAKADEADGGRFLS